MRTTSYPNQQIATLLMDASAVLNRAHNGWPGDVLLLHANRFTPTGRLVDGLWEECSPGSAGKPVQHNISSSAARSGFVGAVRSRRTEQSTSSSGD
jgi:hypothetical protein